MADHNNNDSLFSRRDLVAGAGMLAMLGIQDAIAGGHTGDRPVLSEEEQLALEKANAELVSNFVADYSTRDADVLNKYVTDDIIYQITPGMKDIVGAEAFHKHNANMFEGLDKVEWVNLRQFAVGQIVINDRIDDFFPYPGSKTPRMRFRVAGYFLIEDNKIKVWKDFPYPGSKQLIEPAPKA
ncbi:MAG: SnoaL-like domain-containing protein [Gammaproteobacteria bacterium]|nr:SnoaL-like domain-containing protein [Gammaproteobacteria bacterium]